ncbi:9545_t:CDS:2, partial [Scutellospora calospora]
MPISASTVEDRGDGTEPIIGEWRPHASTTQIDEDEEDPDALRNFKILKNLFQLIIRSRSYKKKKRK